MSAVYFQRLTRTLPKYLRPLLLASALVAGLAVTPSSASQLRDGLSKVPQEALESQQPFSAYFIDIRVLRSLSQADPRHSVMARIADPFQTDVLQAYALDDDKAWTNYTGLPADGLRAVTAYAGKASNTNVAIWQFTQKSEAGTFLQGLQGRGFAERDSLWANGEPLKMNLTKVDPHNPFAGMMGFPSVVSQLDSNVLQSHDPQAVKIGAAVTEAHSLATLPAVSAALDALDRTFANAIVPQVYVISPSAWTSGAPDLMEAMQDKKLPKAVPGVPPSFGALLIDADMANPARQGVIVLLPYADCQRAEMAETAFADRWKNSLNQENSTAATFTGAQAITSHLTSDDQCTAVISLLVPTPADPKGTKPGSNPVLRYILDAIARRDFAPLQGS